jgi:hypothetical protein
MADSKFLQYQDANGDGLIDVCGEFPDVNEEFCPGCIPNACAIVPIWQTRRKWEPYLNEKICKYQITKGTWYTTTNPDERPPPGADIGPESETTEPPSTESGATSGCDLGAGGIGTGSSGAATDVTTGGISREIFDKFADEIILALLEAYNKDTSQSSRNIIKRYLEYTDWELAPRPKSRLKLLYSVAYEVLQGIPDASEVEEEEEIDESDIEASYSAADLEIKLIRIRKGLDLFSRYLDVFRSIEQSNILYLNPEDFGKAKIFNLEAYGDRGWSDNDSVMGRVWLHLKGHIKDKGYYLDASRAWANTKERVSKITFLFTYDYKIKKVTIYTVACPQDPIVVGGPELAERWAAFNDVTAMAYLSNLVGMENDLIARVPMEWTEFLVKYTYPEVYVSTYPEELYEDTSVSACIAEALAAEGKQIGEDILNLAFGLGDAIAYRFHETLCSTSADDVRQVKIRMGLLPGVFNKDDTYALGGERTSSEPMGERIQHEYGVGEEYHATTVAGMAKVQAFQYVQSNPMLFDYLCIWLGEQAGSKTATAIGMEDYSNTLGNLFDRLKACGLLDMLAQVIQCLTGGLSFEEAIAGILKATFEGMSLDSFDKFFVGLSEEDRAALDALVKENLESGNVFEDSSAAMAQATDDIVGNYNPSVTRMSTQAELDAAVTETYDKYISNPTSSRRKAKYDEALDAQAAGPTQVNAGTGWQGFRSFRAAQLTTDNWQSPTYDYSGYGGMEESDFESYLETSRRTLAPSYDGGDSWTEFFAGDTGQLDESVVLEAYAQAVLEMFKGRELELVDQLNTLPGAPLIASIIATTACPRSPFMSPSFTDIIKDFEFPWICGREFVWPEVVFMNPFKRLLDWQDIMSTLFQVAKQVIKEALVAIVAALMMKLCELLGNAICKALEVTGDLAKSAASGGRESLRGLIKESICGPDADDETVDQTIVDMVALMGDAGAGLADSEVVRSMVEGISSVMTGEEMNKMVSGGESPEGSTAAAVYLSYEFPQFSGLHSAEGVTAMFKNIGRLMPLEFRDNIKKLVDATPEYNMMPANPSLCATPEQIEEFCNLRAQLLEGRATPEQIQKSCDDVQRQTRNSLEELVKPFQNFDKHVACNMPPLVSDPGCDNGILPFEPEPSVEATTSVLNSQLEALKTAFSTDMIGNGPFMRNWGMVNMILADTMASPLTTHHRKSAAGWLSKDYIDFYTEDTEAVAEGGSNIGKIWDQRGAYPLHVAEWLAGSLAHLPIEYNSNNELAPDMSFKKGWAEYDKGLFRSTINVLALPDFGYNVEFEPTWVTSPEDSYVTFIKKARKKTADLSLLFEDNAKGLKRRGTDLAVLFGDEPPPPLVNVEGDENFSWGFQLEFFNADLVNPRRRGAETPHNVFGDTSRIKIHEFFNQASNTDVTLAALALPEMRNVLSRDPDKEDAIITDMKYEFIGRDDTLELVGSETLNEYPMFMSTFEDALQYSPPVVLLYEMLQQAGAPTGQSEIKDLYDDFMTTMTQTIVNEVATNAPAFDYGADFDSLQWDEVEYVVDTGQTKSPGGTSYGLAEVADEDGGTRPIQNQDQILGISKMEWLIKNGDKEGENRIYYLDPITYGGNYMSPPLYIKPLMHKGWLGFVDVLFPELSPCKPQKSDLVDFEQIQAKMSEVYPSIPQDPRLLQHPDCVQEWPYARILDRSAVAGLQGLIMATIRIYASTHFIKSMATFTKFYPKFPEVFSSLYASYIVEDMEATLKDAQSRGEALTPFKDEKFWYAFLEQSVQMYSRRLEADDIEAPMHVVGAITRLNDMMEDYQIPTEKMHDEAREEHETRRLFIKKYRGDEVLEEVKATEEDAKLILKELVVEQLNYMGKKFVDNLDVVEMSPDVFDLDYYLLENLAQGGDDLNIDHEIKYTYPNLPSEPAPDEPYYTYGGEFVVYELNNPESEYYVGQAYIGYYHVYVDEDGNLMFMAGEYHSEDPHDVLVPLVNQTSIDIGDVASYGAIPISGDTRLFGVEKYIRIGDRILEPEVATDEILSNENLSQNISDVYPGDMELLQDSEGNVVGVEGELGVRYGLMFSMIINGSKYEITSAEVDALDLPLGEFKTLEANSKLLLCLINNLKEDGKFKLISKYIFPLSKITAVTAIYNDMSFLESIGEVTAMTGATWAKTAAALALVGSVEDKPGRYMAVDVVKEDDKTYVDDVRVWGTPGWASIEDRTINGLHGYRTYDEWDKDLLTKSKRRVKRLFKSYYNSRKWGTFGKGEQPGAAFLAELKERISPSPGMGILPWWRRRKLRSNPFNAEGELCENED